MVLAFGLLEKVERCGVVWQMMLSFAGIFS
jgi:hypothetical protein